MASRNVWRDTARPARVLIFDAKAIIPVFVFFAHAKWWTFWVAVVAMVAFAILDKFDVSIPIALRMFRTWIAGRIKYGVAWWHKPQRKLR